MTRMSYQQGKADGQFESEKEIKRLTKQLADVASYENAAQRKRIEQLEAALREIVTASGDDDDSDSQHYIWIQDTAREALEIAGDTLPTPPDPDADAYDGPSPHWCPTHNWCEDRPCPHCPKSTGDSSK